MSDKDKILNSGLIEQYVLGLLDENEIAEVEESLRIYPELRKHKEAIEETMELILMQNAIAKPISINIENSNLIDDTRKERAAYMPDQRSNNRWILSVASGLILMSAGITFLSYQGRRDAEKKLVSLEAQYEALETSCRKLQAYNDHEERERHFIQNSHRVVLKGTRLAPDAVALVYWNNHEKGAYLNALNLPIAPEDKEYQLWADVDGEMINIGTFDETKKELQLVNYIPHAESLNITLEPKGNNKIPTVSQLYVNGKV
jgi:anti-sigma-K factor RskA